jgi:hypothetical protein
LRSALHSPPSRFPACAFLFVPNPACRRPQRLCWPCCGKLTAPYEIVLEDDTVVHAIHITSRLLNDQQGLLALDLIPAGAFLPYPGKMVDDVGYTHFKTTFGAELSHEWARGGPKHFGSRVLLFGQFARASPRSCAHFVNCAEGTGKAGNCKWDAAKIDARFVANYDTLDVALAPTETYPGVRTKADIQPGEELLITKYGGGFWDRMEREWHDEGLAILRPVALTPAMLAVLESTNTRRGMKRARTD